MIFNNSLLAANRRDEKVKTQYVCIKVRITGKTPAGSW
jgi:hypothetical protein